MLEGNQLESGLQEELQEQEDVLGQSIEKLDSAKAKRLSLVSLLKEALQEQVYLLPLLVIFSSFLFFLWKS